MSDDGGLPVTVIRKARWRIGGSVAVSAIGLCFLVGVYWWVGAIVGHEAVAGFYKEEPIQLVLTVLPVFGMVFLLGDSLRSAWWGDTIKLDRAGFRCRINGHSRFVRWEDVKQFRVERPAASMRDVVGWDHQDDAFNGNPVWEGSRAEGQRTATLDCDLGWGWQDGAAGVCTTLEAWRVRHSGKA